MDGRTIYLTKKSSSASRGEIPSGIYAAPPGPEPGTCGSTKREQLITMPINTLAVNHEETKTRRRLSLLDFCYETIE